MNTRLFSPHSNWSTGRCGALWLIALCLVSPVFGQESDWKENPPPAATSALGLANEYILQPDVWRPASPSAPGVDAKGDLNLSLPVMTVPGRNGMDFTIRFDYRSGIKLMQQSSWIGLGWSFDPGSITRDVQGGLQMPPPDEAIYNVDYADEDPHLQPDIYYVTTPGGSFSMTRAPGPGLLPGRSEAVPYPFVPDVWRPWKIAPDAPADVEVPAGSGHRTEVVAGPDGYEGPRQDFPGFTLTAEDGTRYVFGAPTLTTYTGSFRNVLGGSTKEVYVSTWRLVEMQAPDYANGTGNWIRFHYSDARTVQPQTPDGSKHQVRELTEIETPTHRATFYTEPRVDVPVGYPWQDYIYRRLREVRLYAKQPQDQNNGILLKSVVLIHATGDPGDRHHGGAHKRIKLKEIQFLTPDGAPEPGYRFAYHDDPEDYGLFSDQQDDFGYYNDGRNDGVLINDLDATPDDGKAWSLSAITFPTGGREEYVYENDRLGASSVPFKAFVYVPGYEPSTATEQYDFADGQNVRQGGARVREIRRYADPTSTDPVNITTYAYGPGRASGVPEYYLQRFYGSRDAFYNATSRGKAEVYYEDVKRIHADGTFEQTLYSTGPTLEITYLDLARAHTVATGNQHITWGIPTEVSLGSAGGQVYRRTTQVHFLNTSPITQAFPDYSADDPSGVDIVWRRANTLATLTTMERGDAGLTSVSTRNYGYSLPDDPDGTGLVKSLRETFIGGERETRYTYGYEIGGAYGDLFETTNQLNAVVKTDVRGRPRRDPPGGASAVPDTIPERFYASTVTKWKLFPVDAEGPLSCNNANPDLNHCRPRPYRTYQWLAPRPVVNGSAPAFDAWAPDETPGSAWKRQATFLAYDDFGHVKRLQDPLGRETTFFYGNSEACSDAGAGLHHAFLTCVQRGTLAQKMAYDDRLRLRTIRDSNDDAVSFSYDPMGRLKTVENAAGQVITRHTYRLGAVPLSVQTGVYRDQSDSTATKTFFDGLGRPVQTQVREGGKVIVSAVDYDAMGRDFLTWKPYRHPASNLAYDPHYADHAAGYYEARYGPGTHPYTTTHYTTDGLSRVAETILPYRSGQAIPRIQQHYGLAAFDGSHAYPYTVTVDEALKQTKAFTDAEGNTLHLVAGAGSPEAASTEFVYDALGNLLLVEPPNHFSAQGGTAQAWNTWYTYDTLGRLTAKSTPDADGNQNQNPTDEANGTTAADFRYRYDDKGNLRMTEDPNRQGTGAARGYLYFDYDAFDRITETGICAGGDFENDPVSPGAMCPSGTKTERVSYTYDVVPADRPLGGLTISNPRGNLTQVVFEGGYYQYSYDDEGRVEAMHVKLDGLPGKLLAYAYDWQGNTTRISYAAGTGDALLLTYTYDGAGRLWEVRSQVGQEAAVREAAYMYTDTGQVEQLRMGTLQPIDYHYHLRDWLARINDVSTPGADPFALGLAYEPNGNVAMMEWATQDNPFEYTPGQTTLRVGYLFDYDDRNRLTTADFQYHDGSWRQHDAYDVGLPGAIDYDGNGNILRLTRLDEEGQGQPIDYHYAPSGGNRLQGVSGGTSASFTYDANGNVNQSRVAAGASYDRRNLPTQMDLGDGSLLHFVYDADGRRVHKQLADPDGPISDTYYIRGADGSVLAVYVRQDDGLQLAYWNILSGSTVIGRIVPATGSD